MNASTAGLGALAVLTLFIDIWALVKVFGRPAWAFESAGKSKGLWIFLIIAGIFVCNVGFFVSLWYLFSVDTRVRRVQQLGPGIGFPGA